MSFDLFANVADILEGAAQLWQNFVSLLISEKDFTPVRYDPDEEPPRYELDTSDLSGLMQILTTRSQNVLLERYDPYYMFYTVDTGTLMSAGPVNFEHLTAEKKYFEETGGSEAFLSFSKKMFALFGAYYGRIYHWQDKRQQNKILKYFPPGHPSAGEIYSETGFGGDTRKGIPGVYWANFFGRIYVDTIGRGKFLTAPCYRREELPDGGFLLITSESPLDWDKPDVQELRKAMRDHLGYEYFCDIKNPDRRCKVPSFDFSVWEKELERARNAKRRLKD